MQTIAVKAQKREAFGKKASSQIRKNGLVPGIIYSKDGVDHVVVSPKDLKPLIFTPEFKLAEIEIDGHIQKAIVKDVQFHPVTENVVHIDFLKLIDGHPILCEVPVVFKGESPGVGEGGTLTQTLRRIKLKTTPQNMVDAIIGDISEMALGSSLKIKDLEIPEGIEVLTLPTTPVAIVAIPRAAKLDEDEEEVEGEEGEEGTEGAEGGETETKGDAAAKE